MNALAATTPLEELLRDPRLWRGRADERTASRIPTDWAALDAALPGHGWPEGTLAEVLHPGHGLGEIQLLWPALARLTQAGQRVILVAPPHLPHAPAWQAAGVVLAQVSIIEAPRELALWAMEQCLRSGACAAVLGWPGHAEARSLRRLQTAAASNNALGFVFRPPAARAQASPAALRLELAPGQVHIRKCRGRNPAVSIAFARPPA